MKRDTSFNQPWLDIRLTKKTMNYLWDIINTSDYQQKNLDARGSLAGNISKSNYVQDKDNLFYKNVLKEFAEYIYFGEWNNYYQVAITKSKSPPIFTLKRIWVNYQKQHEFNPPHHHDGVFSFVVFMKIPTHWKEQHALPISVNSFTPHASDFQFLLGDERGLVKLYPVPLSPEDEGRMFFFPAWLKHQVFPFYGTEEERITLSGNIVDETKSISNIIDKEQQLKHMKKDVKLFENALKYEKKKKEKN